MSKDSKTSESKNLPAVAPWVDPSDLPAVAAGLVHEVKNPLAAMHLHLQLLQGYAQDISEEDLRDRVNDKVNLLKNQITNLNQSLQEFIRLIRSEQRDSKSSVDFNKLIHDIVEFLEPQALREGILLEFQPGDVGESFSADPTFLRQVVMNLIINSIQAFENSERAHAERSIQVVTGTENSFAFVRVIDNGPGIPEEVQQRIFDPFYSTKEKGSGLGLSLVKRMIAAMGGRLDLHTEPGRGTSFTVFVGDADIVTEGAPQSAQQT